MRIKLLVCFFSMALLPFLTVNYALSEEGNSFTELQTDVTVTKSKAEKNETEIQNLKGGLPAEAASRMDADEDLQSQINNIQLTPGPQGEQGDVGPAGPPGAEGSNGLSCWDLNGDDIADADEDVNGDGYWNALDCQGSGVSIQGTLKLTMNSYEPYPCDNGHIGDIALTSFFTTCVCNGTNWVLTSDGTTSCAWGTPLNSCDSMDVTLCTNSGDCLAAGGYWWSDDTCLGVAESETVVSADGRIWMDRNLGASQVATSPDDSLAYGDLYQWGRGTDGHQLRTSNTTSVTSSTDDPGHGDFIYPIGYPENWRVPHNDNLWQGVSGINNPCPAGFRLPTDTELDTERLSWSSNDHAGAFASPLKLTRAGFRRESTGTIINVGITGYYWSSTVYSNALAHNLLFWANDANVSVDVRAYGCSVRCIKD
jgi:uncharacterized protein (TIGR02145 family)